MPMLIAVLLAAFGLWTAFNGAVLLMSGGTPLLMLLFIAQGVVALAAAYGVARAAAGRPGCCWSSAGWSRSRC